MYFTQSRYRFGLLGFFAFFAVASASVDTHFGCLSKIRADVLFVIEASSSIDPFSYEYYLKDYINDVVRKFTIGEQNVLVSIVLYSNDQIITIKPKDAKSLPQLLYSIRGLPYLADQTVSKNKNSQKLLLETINSAFPPRTGAESNTTRMAVFITSGNFETSTAKDYSIAAVTDNPSALLLRMLRKLGMGKNETAGANESTPMHSLQDKIKELSDFVISIGLKGADPEGVRSLTKEANHVVLIDNLSGYSALTTDVFDPTLALCPITAVSDLCAKADQSTLISASKKKQKNKNRNAASTLFPPGYILSYIDTLWNGYQRLRFQLEQEWRLRLRRRLEILLRRLVNSQDQPIAMPAVRAAIPDNSIPIAILPQQSMGHILQNSQLFPIVQHEQTRVQQPLIQGWPLMQAYNEQSYRQAASSPSNVRAAMFQTSEGEELDDISTLLRELLKHYHSNSTEPDKLKGPEFTEERTMMVNSEPLEGIAKLLREVKAEHNQGGTDGESDIEKELVDFLLKALTEASPGQNDTTFSNPIPPPPPYKFEPCTQSITHLTETWQDSALHGGAILMFAVHAYSGHSLASLYSTAQPPLSNVNDASWFKHVDFDQWTLGAYQKAMLELWRDGHPVVRLTFNAEHADRYTWFRGSTLLESYPWSEKELKEQGIFLRNRNELFSVIHNPDKTPDSLRGGTPTCAELRGYLLNVDADSSTSACSWLHPNIPHFSLSNSSDSPQFIYTLTPELWADENEQSTMPRRFSTLKGVYKADELRIYVVPYSLNTHSVDTSVVRAYTLLFALDTSIGISFSKLWHSGIMSAPGYQPIQMNDEYDESTRKPCQCWYRSRAIENWHRPVETTSWSRISTVLTGFKEMHVQLSGDNGEIIVELVFDTRGSWADSWFAPNRLRAAQPWSVEELHQYSFVQFGQLVHLTQSIQLASEWYAVSFWIGKYMEGSVTKHQCDTLLLVIDPTSPSFTLPPCIIDRLNGNMTSSGTTIYVRHVTNNVIQYQIARQITIWSK